MKRKLLSVFCLLLFVGGTLVVPTLHNWEVANRDFNDSEKSSPFICLSACCCHGSTVQSHSSDGSEKPSKKHHDSGECLVCQIAHLPIDVSVPLTIPQLAAPLSYTEVFVTQSFDVDFKRYRVSPFSCGPPC